MNAEPEGTRSLLQWVAGLDSAERVLVILAAAIVAHWWAGPPISGRTDDGR
jgi:hypothetical protein